MHLAVKAQLADTTLNAVLISYNIMVKYKLI